MEMWNILFKTLSYKKINRILKQKDLKFQHPEQLSNYIAKHPKIIYQAISKPESFNQAIQNIIQVFVPELRESKHVYIMSHIQNHIYIHIYIENANQKSPQYWLNLDHDFSLCKHLPLYYLTMFLHRMKPAYFNLYQLWKDYPNHFVKFSYENNLTNNMLDHKQPLYYTDVNHKRQSAMVVIKPLLQDSHIHKIKNTRFRHTAWYDIYGTHYLIYSRTLFKLLKVMKK